MGKSNLWSIILAGGEGERLTPFVQRWLGRHKAKQYCTFIGTRSMFQHTLDRADLLSDPERKVTVIAQAHREEVMPQLVGRQPGRLIFQPTNRDTAVGVFLALTHVRACDPEATVVLYPSDHFVCPEDRFVDIVQSAVRAAMHLKDLLFLLAVPADRLELEYGWIQPTPNIGWVDGHRVRTVEKFVEKPSARMARAMMASGALWNTLILATRVRTLWALGWRYFPEMMSLFERYTEVIGTCKEEGVLKAVYEVMPARNFSSHLLASIPQQITVIELSEVLWSDWGKAERIVHTLDRIGKYPLFPLALARAVA